MDTITKKNLCDRIAETYQLRSVLTKKVVQTFLEEIIAELEKGNRLEFREFGVFESRLRKGREGQNPQTLEKVPIPDRRSIIFKMGRTMKQRLNGENRVDSNG